VLLLPVIIGVLIGLIQSAALKKQAAGEEVGQAGGGNVPESRGENAPGEE
jgi:hypothetical protein